MRRFGRAALAAVCLWHAAVCLAGQEAWGEVGGELATLEWAVGVVPDDCAVRSRLAGEYERRGLVEEALEQYLEVLVREPREEEARERVEALVGRWMPRWLPAAVEEVQPFRCESVELGLGRAGQERVSCPTGKGQSGAISYRLLVTGQAFAAREGERWDEVHGKALPWVDYGYVWEPGRGRWAMKVRVHWGEAEDAELAREAARATLVCYCLARGYLGCDPTEGSGAPVDVWLGRRGRPGARAVGRSMYLYSVKTPRARGEWWRQVGHEYGHIALPGIGGFAETDDPWADGHVAELLFPKWLAESGAPEWAPWSAEEWEREARVRREQLKGLWSLEELQGMWQEEAAFAEGTAPGPPAEGVVWGSDEESRDRFLGLVVYVEEEAGPGFLGEALRRCARGSAADFADAVENLGAELRRLGASGAAPEAARDERDD